MNVRRTGRHRQRLRRLHLQRPSAEQRTGLGTGTDVSQVSNVELQRQNKREKILPGWSERGTACPNQRQMSTS